jgi:hypothetical protein
MGRNRLEDLPSPLTVFGMAGEAVRDEEGLDCLRSGGWDGNQGGFSFSYTDPSEKTYRRMYRASNLGFSLMSGVKTLPHV